MTRVECEHCGGSFSSKGIAAHRKSCKQASSFINVQWVNPGYVLQQLLTNPFQTICNILTILVLLSVMGNWISEVLLPSFFSPITSLFRKEGKQLLTAYHEVNMAAETDAKANLNSQAKAQADP